MADRQKDLGRKRNRGFTLIELAIVIAITGLLMAAFLQFYAIEFEKSRLELTRKRMDNLRVALAVYAATNNRLPCPGIGGQLPPLRLQDDNSDKRADACVAMIQTAAPVTGTSALPRPAMGVTDTGRDDIEGKIWTGVVPVRDLRLAEEDATDGWGNRFSYVVTRALTKPEGLRGNPTPRGVLRIFDGKRKNLLDMPGSGRYVIISHGKTGNGAWTQNGVHRTCDIETLDGENCNGDATFIISGYALQPGPGYYDDIVIHDNSDVRGSPLDRLIACNAKKGFYAPADPVADPDGCVLPQGIWHGACLRGFTLDGKGNETASGLPKAVLPPAIVTGADCGCDIGYKPVKIGAWDDNASGPYVVTAVTGTGTTISKVATGLTALYTCSQ